MNPDHDFIDCVAHFDAPVDSMPWTLIANDEPTDDDDGGDDDDDVDRCEAVVDRLITTVALELVIVVLLFLEDPVVGVVGFVVVLGRRGTFCKVLFSSKF